MVSRDWNALAMHYLAQARSLELTTVARVVREVVERLLPSIPNLRSLNVGKCYKLTSADVGAILKSCPQLQALHFEGCRIADAALRAIIAANPPLRALNLRDCKMVTDSGMKDLFAHFAQLQYLNVSGCKIQRLGIGEAESQDSLRLLDISRTTIRGEALTDIAKRFPRLFHLNLEECSQVNEAWLKTCFSSPCPALTSLNLSWNSSVTDDCLESVTKLVATHCPRLENLQLEQCYKITDHCLTLLADSCPSLRFLKIRGCNKITAEGLAAFASLLPGCRVLQEKGQRKDYRLVLPDDPLAPLTFL
ncbi:leucine rich repeat domain containing protein [Acanthamoeba castellanii str. Neff]|uniref:Leucine rich repeat domain containing protein n=1 Tax=Acanthamoeba castellanii (strain ATCC 30010 / Neff) TaxID=1257118 RepID=L8H8Y6_ACACF|nr:leucine rich repeat domain containing protein [Acanthamoeba castellanii str. Neff]ELR21198.1 leucine rich repeat domain containing protein [Acanthamoeba castellanii str. Neff]